MKSKKWLALLLSAAMLVPFGAVGCNNGSEGGNGEEGGGKNPPPATPTSVGAPTVSMTGNILSWNEVKDAECYSVHYILNGQDYLISEKQQGTTFVFTPTEVGEYSFYVVAINQTYNLVSENSATVSFTYEADTSVALASDAKIYLVGDSTVCSFSDNYYLPRYGYGTQLFNYLNCQPSQIVNLAISGRSSLSFLSESNYTTLTNQIKEGDYLIIGFGHNDEKSDDPARFTSANGNKETAGSFQKTLYDNYVKLAKDKGATPILCTPIVRYDASGNYTGNTVHSTPTGDYAQAIKTLGAETNTTVIDLTSLTKNLYKSDNEAAAYFHAATSYKGEKPNETPNGRDGTHINKYGAKMISYMLANALLNTDCSLKNNIITNALAPSYAVDFKDAINNSYVRPVYEAFDESSTAATTHKKATLENDTTQSNWYSTVIGDVGGASKLGNFTTAYSEGVFTVGTATNSGKFQDASDGTGIDGFGSIFTQVSVNHNFTVTAKAKITTADATNINSQSAFGLMLRDDIYIDNYNKTTNGNFVAAGLWGTSAKANVIFSRAYTEDGSRISKAGSATTANVGNEYELTLKRVGQSVDVTVKVVGGQIYTYNYTDFDFVSTDNDYMYVCLFATRGYIVDFSEVNFEITGTSQGA